MVAALEEVSRVLAAWRERRRAAETERKKR
jgi:hypothetical protein